MRENRSLQGFTLMELMVAMAVGSLILLAAASFLGGTGDTYNRVGGNVAAEREARAVLSQMADDLATAVYHEDGVFENSGSGWASDKLGFLSLQTEAAQNKDRMIGDLCAVNYYLDDLEINGTTVRCLMRGFRDSADAFEALGAGSVSSLFTKVENVDEPVAFGVVSFEARPKTRDEGGSWVDWSEAEGEQPEAVEVRLVVARKDLAAKLGDSGGWDGGGSAAGLLGEAEKADENENLEVYQTLLRFGNDAR